MLTARHLGQLLGVQGATSYTAPEAQAVRYTILLLLILLLFPLYPCPSCRYKQSEACRLTLDTGHSAFLKRIVLRELPSALEKARWGSSFPGPSISDTFLPHSLALVFPNLPLWP